MGDSETRIPAGEQLAAAHGEEEPRRPAVTVCLPVSRGVEALSRALRSVLAQDLHDVEVIIGDETGQFRSLIESIGDERIVYRHNEQRLGYGLNHVTLLDCATGRHLAVLHDDDWWDPQYLSTLVAALDADPALGVACSAVSRDLDGESGRRLAPWPIPLEPGRNDDVLPVLLREEWFLLPTACVWRRQVWSGQARQWHLDLRTTDLQLFLSAAEAGWSFYFHPDPLAHWVQHPGQSGASRGGDFGMAAADDALEFWRRWLQGRPAEYGDLSSKQRAQCHLRRARAFVLTGRRAEARSALREATALGGRRLSGRLRLAVAVHVPSQIVRGLVGAKRMMQRAVGRLES